MRWLIPILMLSAGVPAAQPASAQNRDGYPYSIMRDEPGTKSRKPDLGWEKDLREPAKKPIRGRRIGSSSSSPLPAPRSVVTPLGTAPRTVETPPMGTPASPGMIVPGIRTTTGGPAVTPPRPAGQNFQDRAIGCVHAGSGAGVGAGQIGAYTQSCVNQ